MTDEPLSDEMSVIVEPSAIEAALLEAGGMTASAAHDSEPQVEGAPETSASTSEAQDVASSELAGTTDSPSAAGAVAGPALLGDESLSETVAMEPKADAAPAVVTDEPDAPPAPAAHAPVRRSVAAEVARRLYAVGARYCFTVPGSSILPLLDELASAGIRVVSARHEAGAAFMAEALAQSTGRPQIVAVSRSVGAAGAAIGIHTASQDSVPLVVLAGQVERAHLGREAFQESDLVHGIGSLAPWAAQLDDPAQVPALMARAARRLTTGRPGPILLALPRDVQEVEIEVAADQVSASGGARGPAADHAEVRRVLRLLAASERGVIVAGGGVLRARASKRLVALSEALAVPVIASWRRPDVFPNDHPNYLGMSGAWSPATVRQRLTDADVIVFIGARPSQLTTFDYSIPGLGTRWAHVDVQPTPAGDGPRAPAVSVEADASRFLDAAWSDLRGAALDHEMRSRREARMAADRAAYRAASTVGQGTWPGPGVHPGRVIDTLRAVLPDNATLATDAGNMGGWLARGYRFRRAGTFLGATSGAMGFGLPAAVAASLHDGDRIAVAICGDGGFAMSMMELETAVREGGHPIVLVLDDGRYGTTAMQQAREGRETTSSQLRPLDVAAIARAHGALGFTVEDDAAFEPALREAIASRQTSVLHLALDRSWVSVDELPAALSD
jgi:acetolactate synthase-1/2/3 large subunit